MDVLSPAELLARAAEKPDVPIEAIECPELGGSVYVRAVTGTIRNRLEAGYAAILEGADGKLMDAVLVALVSACLVDERGHSFMTVNVAKSLFANYPGAVFRIRDKAVAMSDMERADKEALTETFE